MIILQILLLVTYAIGIGIWTAIFKANGLEDAAPFIAVFWPILLIISPLLFLAYLGEIITEWIFNHVK